MAQINLQVPGAEIRIQINELTVVVSNIQGNLILALSEFFSDSGSSHWMYAGTAIRMAQIMRLNKEYHHMHSEQEREIRRRTFWACLQIDRVLAFYLAKPHTLAIRNIASALPGNYVSLAYGEATRNLTLEGLDTHLNFPSDIGLQPYLIKSICLWGDLADFHVCQERMASALPPTNASSRFSQLCKVLETWISNLLSTVKWSKENYSMHFELNNEDLYLGIHCLLQSAFCVAHQDYLPQTDESSILLDNFDSAGWSLIHQEPEIIAVGLKSALNIGEIVSTYLDSSKSPDRIKPSLFIALAITSSSNCLLWLQYFPEPDNVSIDRDRAAVYFENYLEIFRQWGTVWNIGTVWLRRLKEMHSLYRLAYLGIVDNVPQSRISQESFNTAPEGCLRDEYRPSPGDGMPPNNFPKPMNGLLRLNGLTNLDLRAEYHSSVWMALMRGWPQNVDTTSWEELLESQQQDVMPSELA